MTEQLFPYAETVPYWQTSRSTPDTWLDRAEKEIMKRSELQEELKTLLTDLEEPISAKSVGDWLAHLGGQVGLAWEMGEDEDDWLIP